MLTVLIALVKSLVRGSAPYYHICRESLFFHLCEGEMILPGCFYVFCGAETLSLCLGFFWSRDHAAVVSSLTGNDGSLLVEFQKSLKLVAVNSDNVEEKSS